MLRRIAVEPTLCIGRYPTRTDDFHISHKDAVSSVGDNLPELAILCRVFLTRSCWSSRTKHGSTDTVPYRQGTRTLWLESRLIQYRQQMLWLCCSGTLLYPVGGLEPGTRHLTCLCQTQKPSQSRGNFPTFHDDFRRFSNPFNSFPLRLSLFSSIGAVFLEPQSEDVVASISDIMTMDLQVQADTEAFLNSSTEAVSNSSRCGSMPRDHRQRYGLFNQSRQRNTLPCTPQLGRPNTQ